MSVASLPCVGLLERGFTSMNLNSVGGVCTLPVREASSSPGATRRESPAPQARNMPSSQPEPPQPRPTTPRSTRTISPNELAAYLGCQSEPEVPEVPEEVPSNSSNKLESLLLLDCRPFIAYNLNHISGALNVSCCDRFTKRRLQRGTASVGDLVAGDECKEAFKEKCDSHIIQIILYDENTADPSELPISHPLHLVLTSLLKEKEDRQVVILRGMYKKHL